MKKYIILLLAVVLVLGLASCKDKPAGNNEKDNPTVQEPYECNPSFEWEVNPGGLELIHIDGDEILYGTKSELFEFHENKS